MGSFDKVKTAFGSKKEDESQNTDENIVNEGIIDTLEPIESLENNGRYLNENDVLQSPNYEMNMFKHDVFICYSTEDREIAFRICQVLEQNNLECWIAPRNLIFHGDYIQQIMEAIKSTKIVVLVFSQFSQESKYVNAEINSAFSQDKPIFSVNIDEYLPEVYSEYYLKITQWLMAYPNTEDFFEEIVKIALKLCRYESDRITLESYDDKSYGNLFDKDKIFSKVVDQKISNFKIKDGHVTQNKKTKNFKYLDDLIHSGVKEIVLDSDILLSDEEESEYPEGIKLDVNNLIIDGNGHTIDANGKTRIFKCNGENILIKNITLRRGFNQGGAIYNNGNLTITGSIFNENVQHEEIIYNDGSLMMVESTFNGNISSSRGLIINHEDLKIFKCEILDNESSENIICNFGSLQAFNSNFNNNRADNNILSNEAISHFSDIFNYLDMHGNTLGFEKSLIIDEANLSIINCAFINNMTCHSIIFNLGKFCSIEKSIFENDTSQGNIHNILDLILINPKIKDEGKTILNNGSILIKNSSPNILNQIINEGAVNFDSDLIPSEEKFDFGFLDKMIHESTTKKILLPEDIRFEDYESDFYEGGIELDIDDLIIDGDGHSIDGAYKSRIFIITGNNITLKNIKFKNGRSHMNYDNRLNVHGGAIKINFGISLTIENCKFTNNVSEGFGGAIVNFRPTLDFIRYLYGEKLASLDVDTIDRTYISLTDLIKPIGSLGGGTINNTDCEITIKESTFTENTSIDYGGAIASHNVNLTIKKSDFSENISKDGPGGAIVNVCGSLSISKSAFNGNNAYGEGGAIYNAGGCSIFDSILDNNTALYEGGAIFLYKSKKYESNNCTFKNNKPDDVYERDEFYD